MNDIEPTDNDAFDTPSYRLAAAINRPFVWGSGFGVGLGMAVMAHQPLAVVFALMGATVFAICNIVFSDPA